MNHTIQLPTTGSSVVIYGPTPYPVFSDIKSLHCVANSSQYVTMGDNIAFNRTDPFSVSIWVKPATLVDASDIVGKQLGAPSFTGWKIRTTGTAGKCRLFMISDFAADKYLSVDTSSAVLTATTWTHLVFINNGDGTLSLYANAVSAALSINHDTLGANSILNNAAFRLAQSGSFYWTGNLDEPAVYDVALTADQITAIYNAGTPPNLGALSSVANLQHWWRLGDGADTATTTYDLIGSINGTLVNGPVYQSDVP